MSPFPLLTLTVAVPAVGAVVTAALPAATTDARRRTAKTVALVFACATLALAVAVAGRFDPGGARYQLTESYPWIKSFGVGFSLGVDGIAAMMVLLTTVLVPLVMLASWHDADADPLAEAPFGNRRRTQVFFALILAVEAMVVLSFLATDVFLFYVVFEAMLIPVYFLIGGFGDRADGGDGEAAARRSHSALKFLLYNLLGGLVMLAAVIGLYTLSARAGIGSGADGTLDLTTLTGALRDGRLSIDPVAERVLFLGFFFAFAVKAPLWPLHTWLPGAMGEATAGTAALITGVVDKVGTFAMLRLCLELFPGASRFFAPAIMVLAVTGIIYGALVAVAQEDIKRLIAYASISHYGFIVLGIFAMTPQSQVGASFYMVSHGISTATLMLVAGFLISRRGSRLIAHYGGVQKIAPVLAGAFLIGGLANLSLPGLAPFVSEFLVLVGTFTRHPALGAIATLGIVLSALYVLVLYQRTMTGPVAKGVAAMADLRARELLVVAPLVFLLIALGVYPKPVTDIVAPAVDATLSEVHRTDSKPARPAAEDRG
ncbi:MULTISPECIES: NADH-quinone oxidoreductase subunit M [Streptomyces]|uniref:NuoM1 protein n=1 Tax=Streptomyces bottropensis ATCC 25435 TaxID=1054862 RepID=M3FVS7_9ACTN|nr:MULTISPECIES: NADH-quinone oxidoreductase subunit M [Streptomyces]EMF57095.1 nuoM1 protein [Streptomyces bottropensis ATCC 25435]MZD20410.1 NADH-quinone oxidoreductase subunit M [Streptomyces sp. SID5476]